MKITRTNLFLFAGAFACLSSFALAETAARRPAKAKARAVAVKAVVAPKTVKTVVPVPVPVVPVPVVPVPVVPAATRVPDTVAAPVATELLAVAATEPAVVSPAIVSPVVVTDVAARAAFKTGQDAKTAGDLRGAEAAFRQAITLAPPGEAGDRVSMDAAKWLGFIAYDNRDPRTAETFFGAEAVLARRLYFSAKISPRGFADAVGRFASATGAMGRSGDSAALVFYAQEIKARAQAEQSAQLLNRDTNNAADTVTGVRVAASGLCVVGRDPILKDRVSCDDEAGARNEALSMQANQIRANAPPPPSKAEREEKAAKAKAKGG